ARLDLVNPHCPGDVLKSLVAEVDEFFPEFVTHLTIGVFGKADSAGLRDSFQPRRDVDAIAHEIAVGLFDDVAQVNADTKFYTALGRQASIALDHAVLSLDRTTDSVDNTSKLDE